MNQKQSCQEIFSYTLPKPNKIQKKLEQLQKVKEENDPNIPKITDISIEEKVQNNQNCQNQQSQQQQLQIQMEDLARDLKILPEENKPPTKCSKLVKFLIFLFSMLITGIITWSINKFAN